MFKSKALISSYLLCVSISGFCFDSGLFFKTHLCSSFTFQTFSQILKPFQFPPKMLGFDFFNDALCLFLLRVFSVLNGSWNFSVPCSLFYSQIFHCLFLVQSVWSEFSWLVELEASFTGLCFGLIVCSWCLKMGCSLFLLICLVSAFRCWILTKFCDSVGNLMHFLLGCVWILLVLWGEKLMDSASFMC